MGYTLTKINALSPVYDGYTYADSLYSRSHYNGQLVNGYGTANLVYILDNRGSNYTYDTAFNSSDYRTTIDTNFWKDMGFLVSSSSTEIADRPYMDYLKYHPNEILKYGIVLGYDVDYTYQSGSGSATLPSPSVTYTVSSSISQFVNITKTETDKYEIMVDSSIENEQFWHDGDIMGLITFTGVVGSSSKSVTIPVCFGSGYRGNIRTTVNKSVNEYGNNGSIDYVQYRNNILEPWKNMPSTFSFDSGHNLDIRVKFNPDTGKSIRGKLLNNFGHVWTDSTISSDSWKYITTGGESTWTFIAQLFDINTKTTTTTLPPIPRCLLGDQKLMVSHNEFKNIEDLKVGDMLFTAHQLTNEFGFYPISSYEKSPVNEYYKFTFEDKSEIKCSTTHQFMKSCGNNKCAEKVVVYSLKEGDKVMVSKKNFKGFKDLEISKIELIIEDEFVYKIEVEDAHTYITENLIFHHNLKFI